MASDKHLAGAIPHSAGRNRYANKHMGMVFASIIGFILLAIVALMVAKGITA